MTLHCGEKKKKERRVENFNAHRPKLEPQIPPYPTKRVHVHLANDRFVNFKSNFVYPRLCPAVLSLEQAALSL